MDIFDLVAKGKEAEAEKLKFDAEELALEDQEKVAAKSLKVSPFEWIKSINDKNYIMVEGNESQYTPFLVNRGLSQHIDAIYPVYVMDHLSQYLTHRQQYDYLYHSVRKARRYGKWAKATKYDHAALIGEIYECSQQKAIDILHRLTDEDVEQILEWDSKRFGGRIK